MPVSPVCSKPYGVPLDLSHVRLIAPDLTGEDFLWDKTCISEEPAPPSVLEHPDPVTDPHDGYFPCAPKFALSSPTRLYTRGYTYFSAWDTSNKARDKERLLCARMPPNVTPTIDESGNLRIELIPGMVKLIPGVPFVYHLNGDPSRPVTVACLHTTQSLSVYPSVAKDVQDLTDQLLARTFGEVQGDRLVRKPIYRHPGLIRNQRSAQVPEGSFDGSFNLAATVGQGDGQGCYMPAAQSTDPALRVTIGEVSRILHKLYRIILPHSISKFEWDVIEFHSRVNNVFGFGGFEPNNTGLQMNVSSGYSSLTELIGEIQGAFHTDMHDHPPRYTVCTLCFNLPKGIYPFS